MEVHKAEKIQKTFKIELLTPAYAFLEKSQLEIRPTAIKGFLRFWWRFLYSGSDLKDMYKKESEIFGSTDKASSVRVDVDNGKINKDKDKFLEGTTFDLILEYPKKFEEEIKKTIRLWITFGGIGGQQHTGYGKLYCQDITYIEQNEIDAFNIEKEDYHELEKKDNITSILNFISNCYKKDKNLLSDKKNIPFFVGINRYVDGYKIKFLYYKKLEKYLNNNFRIFFDNLCKDIKNGR